jgi:hypothetical protein
MAKTKQIYEKNDKGVVGGFTSVSPIQSPKRVATDAQSALIEGRQQMSSDSNILGN